MGTIGLGMLHVSGRSRVPNPPAMITAFMVYSLNESAQQQEIADFGLVIAD
jgi:hypothetical protein